MPEGTTFTGWLLGDASDYYGDIAIWGGMLILIVFGMWIVVMWFRRRLLGRGNRIEPWTLDGLYEMLQRGMIDEAEYKRMRSKILASMTGSDVTVPPDAELPVAEAIDPQEQDQAGDQPQPGDAEATPDGPAPHDEGPDAAGDSPDRDGETPDRPANN